MTRIEHAERQRHAHRVVLGPRCGHAWRDERGFSLIWTACGFMAMFAATTLAIDVGMLMTARNQAQNSADAGALAGATALAFNSYADRSAAGPAVTSAMNTAKANQVIGEAPDVTPADVTFLNDPLTGRDDIVQVQVHRTAERGNPVKTLLARIYGVSTADIGAVARAATIPADSERCVMPLTIPDRWSEQPCATGGTSCWTPNDTFDKYASQGNQQNVGNLLANPDIYIPPGQTGATGYDPDKNKGLQLVLKNNNQNKVAPSIYNAWDLPGSGGGDDYRQNIATCNPNLIPLGSNMTPENGNMVGPTAEGMQDLLLKDPDAKWSDGCACIVGSRYKTSPRIRIVPLYNPEKYADGQHTGKSQPTLEVVNYLGFFIEDYTAGGQVTGRIMPISGIASKGMGPGTVPIGGFAQAIRLVQ